MELTVSWTPIMFQSHSVINSTTRVYYNSLFMLFSMFPNNIFFRKCYQYKRVIADSWVSYKLFGWIVKYFNKQYWQVSKFKPYVFKVLLVLYFGQKKKITYRITNRAYQFAYYTVKHHFTHFKAHLFLKVYKQIKRRDVLDYSFTKKLKK